MFSRCWFRSPSRAPCRALWIAFVASKNASSRLTIRQSAISPEIVEQRDGRAQQLGDTPSVRRRVAMQNPGAANPVGLAAQRLDRLLGRDATVRLERALADVNALQHALGESPLV